MPQGELPYEPCELEGKNASLLPVTLTGIFYPAGGPHPVYNYILHRPLGIYCRHAPHHTTAMSAFYSFAFSITALTFVFLYRHRLHACFTRCLVFPIVSGIISECISPKMQEILEGRIYANLDFMDSWFLHISAVPQRCMWRFAKSWDYVVPEVTNAVPHLV